MPSDDVAHPSEKAERVCPECATPRSQRSPPAPWALQHPLMLKLAALLIVLGFLVFKNIAAWPVIEAPFTYTTQLATYPKHQYTQAVLEQYAAGTITDGQLARDLYNTYLFGNFELEAVFVPAAGDVRMGHSFGWPAGFTFSYILTAYDDLYEKTNPQPGRTYTSTSWVYLVYTRQRIDAQGRYTVFRLVALALAFQILLVAIAWSLGKGLRWVIFAFHVACKDTNRKRDRFARRLPLLLALACGTVLAVMSSIPMPLQRYVVPPNTMLTGTKTGLTNERLAQLRDDPAGDAKVAATILKAAGDLTLDPNDALIINWSSEEGGTGTAIVGGWPRDTFDGSIHQTMQTTKATTGLPRIILTRDVIHLDVALLYGDPPVRVESYRVSLYFLGLIGMAVYGAWWLPGWIIWIIHGRAKQRAEKRANRGQCSRCGYDLRGLH